MGKGSVRMAVRFPGDLLERVEAAIARRNAVSVEEPQSVAEWIRAAIEAKLRHNARGGKRPSRARMAAEGGGR